jgi:hypothetical protein
MSPRTDLSLASGPKDSRNARALARMLIYSADEARTQGFMDVGSKIDDALKMLSDRSPGWLGTLFGNDKS